jgi:hypothetical protein
MGKIRFIFWLSLASIAFVTGCTTSKPDSEQIDQLMRRTSALEQQVHDLQVSNAELQLEVRGLQQQTHNPQVPRWSPPQNPQVPPPNPPPKNQTPPLTPLDTK